MSDIDLNFLGDNGNYDTLGVVNGFRKFSEMYIGQLVEEGKWFTVCHKIDDRQEDIMRIQNKYGTKLGSMIAEVFEEGTYRTSIYKYLMMHYLCYIEVPTASFKTDTGRYKNTFNKMLATSNVDVIAKWLGVEVDDVPEKYRSRVYGIDMDDGEDLLPYVKLTESREGLRKVSVPRMNIDVSEKGTRVIPLFMLKAGVDALNEKISKDIVKVSFLKDNSHIRDMFITTNMLKVREIYGGGSFLEDCMETTYNGDFLFNPYLARGFIKAPEIGASRYENPVRSISYARIVSIDYNAEPDLSFINIDMSTVLDGFNEGVLANKFQAKDIVDMLEAFGIDGGCWKDKDGEKRKYLNKDIVSLVQWAEDRSLLFSVVFLRELCLFMLSNPQWFGNFTGKPKEVKSNGDVGLF